MKRVFGYMFLLQVILCFGQNCFSQIITTIAGNGTSLGDGGAAINAHISYPCGIVFDATGNLYIADRYNYKIRRVSPLGIITTIAGTGTQGFSGDNGPATSAQINEVIGLAIDASNNLFFADIYNNRVRRVDAITGIITTYAGSGLVGVGTGTYGGDNGLATNAFLQTPTGVALDAIGNLYIADYNNHRIRKVSTTGIITTYAGTGFNSYSGDNGSAILATVNGPYGVAVDNSGNLYIAEFGNHVIRKVSTTGIITTVVGTGTAGSIGDNGLATVAELNDPTGLAFDNSNNMYIADRGNHKIRKVNTSGIITTLSGNGLPGFSGDNGPATTAQLHYPWDIISDICGNIYIADCTNLRIRKVWLGTTTIPSASITVSPNDTVCAGATVTFTAMPVNAGTAPSYQWLKNNAVITGATNSTYSYIPTNGDSIQCIVVSSVPCAGPALSNAIHLTTTSSTTAPTISIAANPTGAVCAGTSVTYTAIITNGGATLTYQWIKNGTNTGTNSGTYTYIPNNGDSVRCVLTSSVACTTPVSSNTINMTVTLPTATSTISISANPTGAVCAGTSVTYTATITNGGTTPSYQWIKNGANTGTNSNTYTYIPNNNDSIRCVLTSSTACTTPVSSNTINMTVNPTVVPTISITANPTGAICPGTSITYTATITNGGSSPIYQWKENGTNTGTNNNSFTYIPNNGDSIRCVLTSNAGCASPIQVSSNSIIMAVNPTVVPTLSISVNPNDTLCADSTATFTATATNEGSNPSYQWLKNGANTGTNSTTYSYIPNNNDSIRCVLTSNASCAVPATVSSNSIHMVVNPNITATVAITGNTNVQTGVPTTYTAITNVTGATYQWQVNGVNAGTNSSTFIYTPGTDSVVIACYITVPANSCASPSFVTTKITVHIATTGIPTTQLQAVQIYPNPADNELHIDNISQTTSYTLQNIVGQVVQQGTFTQQNNLIQIQALPVGMYLLELRNAERQREVIRVVKE